MTGAIPLRIARTGNLIEVEGLDYHQFKLFGLSILWRAHVSSSVFFRSVDLGPHAERLRSLIREENPGEPTDYCFFLSPLEWAGGDPAGVMAEPTRSRLGSARCYRFVFGGVVWAFVVSGSPPPFPFGEVCVNRQGRMKMLVTSLQDCKFLNQALDSLLRGAA